MTTYYIDPELGVDTNNGLSFSTPRKTFPGNSSWYILNVSNDTYLLAAGSRLVNLQFALPDTNGLSINDCTNFRIGVYSRITGLEITDQPNAWERSKTGTWITEEEKSQYYCLIDHELPIDSLAYNNSRGVVLQRCKNVTVSGLYLRNMWIGFQFHANTTGTSDCSLTNSIIEHCEWTPTPANHNAGFGVRIEASVNVRSKVDNVWFDYLGSDCIYSYLGLDTTVRNTWSRNIGCRQAYDDDHCDWLQLGAYPGNLLVENNYVEHFLKNEMINVVSNGGKTSGAVIMSTGSGAPALSGGIIRNNVFISNCQGGYIQTQPGMLITGNKIIIVSRPEGMHISTPWTIESPDTKFCGNIVQVQQDGRSGIGVNGVGNGLRCVVSNNTLIGGGTSYLAIGWNGYTGADSIVCNNVFMNWNIGFYKRQATKTEFGNVYYNCIYPKNGSSDGSSILPVDIGSFELDPLLDTLTYKPLPNSPCINSGTFVGYYSDAKGVPFYSKPTIGAFETWGRGNYSKVRTKRSIK